MLYRIVRFFLRIFFKIFFLFREINKPEKLPEGRLIVCANHISNFDALLMIATVQRNVNIMGKKELFNNKLFAWVLNLFGAFPIDRQGVDRQAIRKSSEILENEEILGIFPEGTRIKNVEERSREKFNNGVAMLAVKNDANILPFTIKGNYKLFNRVEVIYHDIIDIKEFNNESRKALYESIVDRVYEEIYK